VLPTPRLPRTLPLCALALGDLPGQEGLWEGVGRQEVQVSTSVCPWLRPGVQFAGLQRTGGCDDEADMAWRVTARLTSVDLQAVRACSTHRNIFAFAFASPHPPHPCSPSSPPQGCLTGVLEALCCRDAVPAAALSVGGPGADCVPYAPPTPDGVPVPQSTPALSHGLLDAASCSGVGDDPCRVVTAFEGHIVDGRSHSFQTNQWSATSQVDALHWARLPGFAAPAEARLGHGRGCPMAPHVFMRWKETRFLNTSAAAAADATPERGVPGGAADSALAESVTISGFYYISLNEHTGSIAGVYFDPKCVPFQRLAMRPVPAGRDPWLEAGGRREEEDDEDDTAAFSFCAAPPPPLPRRRDERMYR
jgi:hypothetical protein